MKLFNFFKRKTKALSIEELSNKLDKVAGVTSDDSHMYITYSNYKNARSLEITYFVRNSWHVMGSSFEELKDKILQRKKEYTKQSDNITI